MTELIHITITPTKHGKLIGTITLNNPKVLNAQNHEMVRCTTDILKKWADDDNVAMVILVGSGDRALCAGGDIKSLQTSDAQNAYEFFRTEYGLMYLMHTYSKPILAWGNGIVMGGGLGLLAASSHKVVTNTTLMAMPEVSIGLFPDAGASYFLTRMMGKVGLFLGLTGVRFHGGDAVYLGLGDFAVRHDAFDAVMQTLCELEFNTPKDNHYLLSACLSNFHSAQILPPSCILRDFWQINNLMNAGSLLAVDQALLDYQGDSDFIREAVDGYRSGSALTKAITWYIYQRLIGTDKTYSLTQIFDMEAKVAAHCVECGDFREGVRALLIDKDKNPQWKYRLSDITTEEIERYF